MARLPCMRILGNSTGPCGRFGSSSCSDGRHVYVFGGSESEGSFLNDLWMLDQHTHRWSQVAQPANGDAPWPSKRKDHSLIYAQGLLLCFGGETAESAGQPVNDLWLFDLKTKTWSCQTAAADGPSARYKHAATIWNHRMLIYGGGNANGESLADLWSLDLDSVCGTEPKWSLVATAAANMARANACMTTHEGRVYVYGGFQSTDVPRLGDLCRWNFDTLQLEVLADGVVSGPGPRASAGLVGREGSLLVFGGHSTSEAFRDVWEFDLVSQCWRLLDCSIWPSVVQGQDAFNATVCFPSARWSFVMCNMLNSRNFFLGFGRDSNGSVFHDTWVFNVDYLRENICLWPVDGVVIEKVEYLLAGFGERLMESQRSQATEVFAELQQRLFQEFDPRDTRISALHRQQVVERDERRQFSQKVDTNVLITDQKVAKMREDHAADLSALDASVLQRMQSLEDSLRALVQEKCSAEQSARETAVAQLQADLQEEKTALSSEIAEQISSLRQSTSTEISQLSEKNDRTAADLSQRLDALQAEFSEKFEAAKAALTAELQQMAADLRKDLAEESSKLAQSIQATDLSAKEALAQQDASVDARFAELETSSKQSLESAVVQLEGKVSAAGEQSAAQLSAAKEEVLQSSDASLKASMESSKSETARLISQLDEKTSSELTRATAESRSYADAAVSSKLLEKEAADEKKFDELHARLGELRDRQREILQGQEMRIDETLSELHASVAELRVDIDRAYERSSCEALQLTERLEVRMQEQMKQLLSDDMLKMNQELSSKLEETCMKLQGDLQLLQDSLKLLSSPETVAPPASSTPPAPLSPLVTEETLTAPASVASAAEGGMPAAATAESSTSAPATAVKPVLSASEEALDAFHE